MRRSGLGGIGGGGQHTNVVDNRDMQSPRVACVGEREAKIGFLVISVKRSQSKV